MDLAKIAGEVIQYAGGRDNIKSVAHCATRLRLQLKNNDLRNEEAMSDVEGVKGVFLTQSQFQIIFGSGLVQQVYAEVQKQMGGAAEAAAQPEEKKNERVTLQSLVKLLSDIFVPIIPAIVAGGLLMGINNVLTSPLIGGQSIIELYPQWAGLASAINTFANAPFTFLPVLIGFSATQKFGGNPYLGAAMGMIMVHPDLLNAYSIGVAEAPVWNIFGFKIAAIGYQGTVLPVLAVSWILANIEKRLRKVTPTWLDNLTTPLLSILITAFLTFIAVGPILREAGNLLAAGITWMYNTLGFVGGAIFGLAYAPITLTGMHHSFIAIETQLIADSATTGGSFIFSTASMNNVAQGAAVIAVLLLTKDEKMKSICSASGISALLGITEPAMFGVTLKLKYPFYAAIIGSAVGSAYLAATKTLAQAMGAAGIPGFISMRPDHYLYFGIGLILSMAVSFILTVVFWKHFGMAAAERADMDARAAKKAAGAAAQTAAAVQVSDKNTHAASKEAKAEAAAHAAKANAAAKNAAAADNTEADHKVQATGAQASAAKAESADQAAAKTAITFTSPVRGKVMPITQSADPVFASKAMGDGIAVNPTEGAVYAPCDGMLTLLFPTQHAIGITADGGVDVLIHVGIDTVKMDGKGFKALAAQGDRVKRGQKILEFDIDLIRAEGYSEQTMMMVPEAGGAEIAVTPNDSGDETTVVMEVRK